MHVYLIIVNFDTPPHYLGLTNMRYVCMLTKPWQNANIQKIFKMYVFLQNIWPRHHVRLSHVFYEIWKCISHITAATKIQISNINLNFSASDLVWFLLIDLVWIVNISGLKSIRNYLIVQLLLSSVRWSRNHSGLIFWYECWYLSQTELDYDGFSDVLRGSQDNFRCSQMFYRRFQMFSECSLDH